MGKLTLVGQFMDPEWSQALRRLLLSLLSLLSSKMSKALLIRNG